MPNYANSKVYKITSGDLTYIGSTTVATLAIRLTQHRSSYKNWKEGKAKLTSFQVIEKGDYEITLLELCPCQSRDELNARERYWIENTVCVNKNLTGRTDLEYREANRDKINARGKEWREANRDKNLERHSKFYEEHKEDWKTYYQANRERILSQRKTYREANKEEINARRRKSTLTTV
jgi:ketosteroid isomerase-like protein|uniref:GIY-YIG domain-containing protein n=1 Tax=viral metagenome TaxID=1070528 RepID=A0A6C0AHJ2_9ZZZZ